VGKAGLVVWCLLGTACGRIGFDPLGAGFGDASGDGIGSDAVTGDGPPALSCSGLASTCGPAGTSPCCGSPLVPGGMFYRSYDVGPDNMYTDMTNPATVSTFRLDMYEVTVGRFRQFVNAGMGTQASPPPAGAGARTLNGMASQGGWDPSWNASLTTNTAALVAAVKCDATYQSWTDTAGANESLPINCIAWFEAMAFCAWDGGFLPTEAEWNYAEAGGDEHRAYPWSSPASSLIVDCSYANYYNGSTYCVNPPTGAVNRVGSESPNGDGKWGQADLGGNLWEWMLDWYAIPYANPCNDCADLVVAPDRGFRGGGFFGYSEAYLRGAYRTRGTPVSRFYDVGVRCGRTP
jgi:formylglycine-generating enzyme required for sulfatase activity